MVNQSLRMFHIPSRTGDANVSRRAVILGHSVTDAPPGRRSVLRDMHRTALDRPCSSEMNLEQCAQRILVGCKAVTVLDPILVRPVIPLYPHVELLRVVP